VSVSYTSVDDDLAVLKPPPITYSTLHSIPINHNTECGGVSKEFYHFLLGCTYTGAPFIASNNRVPFTLPPRTIHIGVGAMIEADSFVLLIYKATSRSISCEFDRIPRTIHILHMYTGRSLCQAVAIVRVHQLRVKCFATSHGIS
jgi:hypothetical protein